MRNEALCTRGGWVTDEDGIEYAEPYYGDRAAPAPEPAKARGLAGFFGSGAGKFPLEQRLEAKRRGIGRQTYPFAGTICYCPSIVHLFIPLQYGS